MKPNRNTKADSGTSSKGIAKPLVSRRFFAMYSTHDNFSTGFGRKVHIADEEKVLCGYSGMFGVTEIDEQWINQPDPDKELCSRCKKSALKRLSNGS
jgi:hypothetical protein